MKLRKILSAASAFAVAVSAVAVTSVTSSAVSYFVGSDANASGLFASLITNDGTPSIFDDPADIKDITTIVVTATVTDYRNFEKDLANSGFWYGGAFAINSKSMGWTQHTWNFGESDDELHWEATDTRGVYTLTYTQDSPIFTANEEYALLNIHDYSGSYEITITDCDYLNADGVDIRTLGTDTPTEPDKPVAPAEPTVEPDEPDEPTVEPDEPTAEPDEPDEETVEPTVEAEPDWDSYDADAAKAANEAFTFATNETIDLYSVLGEDIYNLAKVDATFTWTAGTGWCGGAGLGNGAVTENGDTWISGPEYGCANANADLVDAGTATQTILDITDNAIVDAASVNEDGETTFAALFVQNWWNGAEAGAKLTKLSFTDADGNVLGELTWGEDAAEAPSNTAAPANDSKGSPDTGVAGVAAAAGVAALAGVAVVVARKRK